MKTFVAAVAFAAAAAAAPQAASSSFSPAEATLELYSALPSSIQALALTNPGAASTAIAEQFATGTPSWFSALPTDAQSYFLAQQAPTVASSGAPGSATITSVVPLSTGTFGNATASVPVTGGTFTNSSTSAAGGNKTATSTATKSGSSSASGSNTASASKASGASSSSSSGAAAVPTALVGGSIAGILGVVGMLAL